MTKEDVEKFLQEEQKKIDEVERLHKEIDSFPKFWCFFIPRYHRLINQCHKVVKSFRLGSY